MTVTEQLQNTETVHYRIEYFDPTPLNGDGAWRMYIEWHNEARARDDYETARSLYRRARLVRVTRTLAEEVIEGANES